MKLSHSAEGLLHLFGSFTPLQPGLRTWNIPTSVTTCLTGLQPITSQHSWVHHPIRLHEGMLSALCGCVLDRGLHTAGFTHFIFINLPSESTELLPLDPTQNDDGNEGYYMIQHLTTTFKKPICLCFHGSHTSTMDCIICIFDPVFLSPQRAYKYTLHAFTHIHTKAGAAMQGATCSRKLTLTHMHTPFPCHQEQFGVILPKDTST